MKFFKKRLSLGIIAAALMIAAASPAMAEARHESLYYNSSSNFAPSATTGHEQVAAAFSDEQIGAYAASAVKITKIHEQMAPLIKAANNANEKDVLFEDMKKRMAGAIEETAGIDVDGYNRISRQAQQDPALANRIVDEVKSRL